MLEECSSPVDDETANFFAKLVVVIDELNTSPQLVLSNVTISESTSKRVLSNFVSKIPRSKMGKVVQRIAILAKNTVFLQMLILFSLIGGYIDVTIPMTIFLPIVFLVTRPYILTLRDACLLNAAKDEEVTLPSDSIHHANDNGENERDEYGCDEDDERNANNAALALACYVTPLSNVKEKIRVGLSKRTFGFVAFLMMLFMIIEPVYSGKVQLSIPFLSIPFETNVVKHQKFHINAEDEKLHNHINSFLQKNSSSLGTLFSLFLNKLNIN